MLVKDFYKIVDIVFNSSGFDATIKLNTVHEIYKGHFPEQPVVPGVMQLQIAKELLEEVTQTKLMMTKVNQVKYLIPIIPNENLELIFNFSNSTTSDNNIKSNITIAFGDVIFTKAKVICSAVLSS